jgi:dolichol-phosphate hexosyltransferase
MKYDKNKVTIILPAKNEGDGIRKVIKSLKKYCGEIIVVDGHSTDKTKTIAKEEGVRFFLDNKKGKGNAVRLGLAKAKNNIVIIFDADGSPNEKDIPKLVLPIVQNKADLVITSRRTGGSFDFTIDITGILRTMGSDFLTFLVNKRFQTRFSDILYCFRAVRKSIVQDLTLTANEFDIEQEMIINCIKKKYRIIEIPSRENARAWGKSKLQTIAGIKLLYLLLKKLYM